ncbi:MAG: cyclic nucleotide-binding domain-containing protein [Desulfobacterales bacterium]|jgi:CRP-like cAMP-binding protein|nr:cyclic nucleotide-binding domain-containing protein [Desulfobacterales bacterium]
MVSVHELKKIVILGYLTDGMVEKLRPLVNVLRFEEGDAIFREGDPANYFYMLKQGKILLVKRLSDSITVSLGAIQPGYSFGWSAMLEVDAYRSNALCAEPSEVYSVRGEKLKAVLDKDPAMGYLLMQRLLRVIKNRYDRRTEQFVKIITSHPDLKNLFAAE